MKAHTYTLTPTVHYVKVVLLPAFSVDDLPMGEMKQAEFSRN